jgi:ABC-2 type transport system ATP-binding protein
LDEPTTGLDPQARRQVWEVVTTFREQGGTVLLTTHYMEEAAELCDRVAIVDHGKVIASGEPDELVASLGAERIVELRARTPLDEETVRGLPSVLRATKHGSAWRLRVSRNGDGVKPLLAEIAERGIDVESLAAHEATLEDVFVTLTGRGLRDE